MNYVIMKRQIDNEIIQLYYDDEIPVIEQGFEVIEYGQDEYVENANLDRQLYNDVEISSDETDQVTY